MTKRKYALIPIKCENINSNSLVVYRILISYKKKQNEKYLNTRYLCCDIYFENKKMYSFNDNCYYIETLKDGTITSELKEYTSTINKKFILELEFKSDVEAIKWFENRNNL